MSTIIDVHAREILDSRGFPAVEVEVVTSSGAVGVAAVPSGASTGKREAVEKRDGGERYLGKGVVEAVEAVNTEIAGAIMHMDVREQANIDEAMIQLDGTENKGRLGANAILGASLACMKAAADHEGMYLFEYIADLCGLEGDDFLLPMPMMNLINGGAHANNKVDIQEFMIAPFSAKDMKEAVEMGSRVFHSLKKILSEAGHSTAVGDEGGFAPNFGSNKEALDWLVKAIEHAGYKAGEDVFLALDVAASEFFKEGAYHFTGEGRTLSSEELVAYYEGLCEAYPIFSIEDGLDEDDVDGWKLLTQRLGTQIQLVGDDLFVTQERELHDGIQGEYANSILIKLNQVGTVTETLETMDLAKESGYSCVISHRSGETEDSTIADFAVGTGAGQIKTGSLSRSDRTAKYNQLLRIDDFLAGDYDFPTVV